MSVEAKGSAARKPRADSQRNRERLMEAAKAGFADVGPEVSLDEIARRAGVGIGTLYRHFPSRGAIVEAVYRNEIQQWADAAARLLGSLPPSEALREWMRLSVDYIATKKVIAAALASSVDGASDIQASSGKPITDAMRLLVQRAIASGGIRPDVDADDLLRAMAGFAYGASGPGWEASARRLIDILMDGLRPPERAG